MTLAPAPGNQPTAPRLRRLTAAVAVPAALIGSALLSMPAAYAAVPDAAGSLTVHYSDGAASWTVPTGTYEVSITAVGGSGADGEHPTANDSGLESPGHGGYGALVRTTAPVVPGEHLHLEPGSVGSPEWAGTGTGPFGSGGNGYGGENGSGPGGGGGAATVVRSDSVLLAVAGGGGGGGGAGSGGEVTAAGGDGADGGNAGQPGSTAPGTYGGSAGTGLVAAGSGPLGAGGNGTPNWTAMSHNALQGGGGGGGGGGWDGVSGGGGQGGENGGWDLIGPEDGGGGGAGGLSYAVDPSPTIGIASVPGDGWVTISWTPGVITTSTLFAPDSVQEGTAVELTDTVAAVRDGLPAPTGTVTFEQVDPATKARTVLGTAPVQGVDVGSGQASLTAQLAGVGTQTIHAIYSGDGTYFPSTSDYVFTTVVRTPTAAPAVTRISPAKGTHLGGTLVNITGRNFTGVTAIKIGGVLMKNVQCTSSTTCTAITPRGTGTKAIRVTGPAGTSALVAADRFTYL